MLKHQITSEYIPAGQLLPDWFFDSFATAGEPNIMVVHPNEFHRQQTIQRIVREHGSCSTDLHVTYPQVIRLLHVDLRLPVLLDDDVQTTLAIHEACFEHAESGGFPLLHSGEFGKWNLTKTGRIMQLHAHVNTLEKPFRWREDPGVEVFDKLLRQVEHRLGGTLPTLVERHVFETLPTLTFQLGSSAQNE